jgi:hypothetical protein
MTDLYAPSGMNENRSYEWRKRHFLPDIDLDDNEAGGSDGGDMNADAIVCSLLHQAI